jgi:N-glycosylase/DNA lyase
VDLRQTKEQKARRSSKMKRFINNIYYKVGYHCSDKMKDMNKMKENLASMLDINAHKTLA